ncbi:MAG: carbohydrate binding family 9 domain-containing protein [Acidobacteriota bacterium]|nr:carbohydrate binding family 9 domain-containing protein [Acidobacteriota bacterium]
MRRHVATVLVGTAVTVAGTTFGQVEPLFGSDDPRPVAQAVRLEALPTLDGEVAADAAWSSAPAATGFVQNTPDEGEPATERTEVRIGFTETTLYLGVVCHDRDPAGIIVAGSRRDSSLSDTDSFQVIFDTYLDGQSGFVFGTNPAGLEFDGQVTGAVEGGLSSGNTFNRNWDGAWEVAAKTSEIGWSAEFAIPFRSLRFPPSEGKPWGINFQRNIRRRKESAYWAPLARQFNFYWVSEVGRLEGIEPPKQHNLQITPYALADAQRRSQDTGVGFETESTSDADGGFDLKWGITPSLTLDATVNTDFAQVEADEQQINLDRFNLFFPEKRPFFLENAGLFSVGVPGEVQLFFSRRIGLGPGGQEIPIDAGLRLSGKLGRNNLGLLAMRASETEGLTPRNDFTVARYSRDLPNRSSLGAIFVNREGGGRLVGPDDTNRTIGFDGQWGIGEYGQLLGFVAKTETPGVDEDEYAYRLGGRYDSDTWIASANYTEVAEGFNPEAGFLSRRGYRKPDGFVLYRVRPKDLWGLHELRPHVSYSGFWDFDDFQETGFLHVDNHWEWKNGYEVDTGVNFRHEGVKEPFEIFPGVVVPAATYKDQEIQVVFQTNEAKALSFETRVVVGGLFGGDRFRLAPELDFRMGERFNGEIEWDYNDIDLPGGAFETNLGRLRVNYSFTPRIFVQTLVQYNDRADAWATNLRFAWLERANTGLFVVYDEVRDIGSTGIGIPGRSLIVKYSRLIDLLR